jgi:thiosulfate reductase cytochrome b subunit
MRTPRRPQPLAIRLTHWINVPTLAVMAMSGLQILRAYPYFGPQGAIFGGPIAPFQGIDVPETLRMGGWLGGARHLHFAFAWILIINALVYLGYTFATGEFRRRFFWPPRDAKAAWHQQIFYVKAFAWRVKKLVSKDPGPAPVQAPHDLYNGLQRAAYSGAVTLGVLEVLSGLAIWKPVTFHRLAWVMGGYDGARFIHFLVLILLGLVLVGHLLMVAIHYKQFPEMVTGGELPVAKAVETKP